MGLTLNTASVTMQKDIRAIIVAAGRGARLGSDVPKAFILLGGRPLFTYSLETFDSHPAVSAIMLVVSPDMKEEASRIVRAMEIKKPLTIVSGGDHRWESARNGAVACPETTDWVFIHDAARPFMTHAVIDSILEKADRYQSVVTVTPLADTIRDFHGDCAGTTIDRTTLVRVGTPQAFHRATLLRAFDLARTMANPPTDEAVLMEQAGVKVGIAWGDPRNFKITTPQDLEIADALVARQT